MTVRASCGDEMIVPRHLAGFTFPHIVKYIPLFAFCWLHPLEPVFGPKKHACLKS